MIDHWPYKDNQAFQQNSFCFLMKNGYWNDLYTRPDWRWIWSIWREDYERPREITLVFELKRNPVPLLWEECLCLCASDTFLAFPGLQFKTREKIMMIAAYEWPLGGWLRVACKNREQPCHLLLYFPIIIDKEGKETGVGVSLHQSMPAKCLKI